VALAVLGFASGSVYLILATISFGELGLDYQKRGQNRKKELDARGWLIRDYDGEIPALRTIEIQNSHQAPVVSLSLPSAS
jgi:hypothetical protein